MHVQKRLRPRLISALALLLPALFSGCSRALGPRAVVRDRAAYSASLSDSWKRQTLQNIVMLRYADPPTYIDVGSIVASYSLQQTASVGGTIESPNGSAVLGAGGTYTNSPTVTYTPLTGSKFIRAIMTPLPSFSTFSPAPPRT